MPELQCIIVEDEVFAVDLSQGPVTVGRGEQATIRIQGDTNISRVHCRIEPSDLGPVLHDLGSRNGTWVGGEKIDWVLLNETTDARVGAKTVQFVLEGGAGGELDEMLVAEEEKPAPKASHVPEWNPVGEEGTGLISAGDLYGDDEDADRGPVFRQGTYSFEDILKFGEAAVGGGAEGDTPVRVDDIALHNTRGQVVHAAENKSNSETAKAIRMLRQLLLVCLKTGASDVHLEPHRDHGQIRVRIDGAMVPVGRIPDEDRNRLSGVVKILCEIDISRKAVIQEGHFSAEAPGRRIDYRASFTPATRGQKLVLRVLDPLNAPQKLRDLGLSDWMYREVRNVLKQDTGMILVCGPTGSGKTTTLYAALRQIDSYTRNIITIEDPVEYEVPGVTQMPVDVDQGATFLSLLRSCLRQDPDVVVLGEIRDSDTAITAMQAASTGHLVLSTVHAKDTVGIIFRLMDLGAEPYLIASTLNLLIAQRLVRVLCDECKAPRTAKPQEARRLTKSGEGVGQIYGPAGCNACYQTGYRGRRALYEMLIANDALREALVSEPTVTSIRKSVEMGSFVTLADAGSRLVLDGVTSLDEMDRTVGWQ